MTNGRRQLDDVSALVTLAENSQDLLSRHAADGRFLYASPSYHRVLGHEQGRLIASDPWELVHPDDREPCRVALSELAQRGAATMTHRLRAHDGRHVWFESKAHAVHDEITGVLTEVQVVSRDITERVEAREIERRQTTFLAVLTRLAVGFTNAPAQDIDAAIDEVLEEAGRFTGFDRAYLFEYDWEQGTTSNTHEWCAPGITPRIDRLQGLPLRSVAQQLADAHESGRDLVIDDTRHLPQDDPTRSHALLADVRTVATVPLPHARPCRGFVGFDAIDEPRSWTSVDRGLLQFVAELITNALRRRDRDRELADSRGLLRIAGAVAHFGGWMFDVASGRSRWTDELARMIGVGPGGEPSFEHLVAMCHPDDRDRLRDASGSAIESGDDWDFELRIADAQGRWRWMHNVGRAERGADGRVVRLWGAIQDVTDQHDASEQVQALADQLTTTMNSVTDSIVVLDHDQRVSFVNDQACRHFDRTADELMGQRLADAMPDTAGGVFHQTELRAWDQRTPQSVTGFFEPGNLWLEANFYPSAHGLTLYFRDVSAQVERERDLQRVADFERATADRLRQLDTAKNAFLTAVSHELRTPLTIVQGMAETLVRLRHDTSVERRERIEDALLEHAQRLSGLVEDLLHVDRLSRGAQLAQPITIDVATLVREVGATSALADRINIDAPDELPATVDPLQVEQLLSNLLSNVEKYAPNGRVRVVLAPLGDAGVRLEVHDQGPGVPDDARERVFEPFVRLDDAHPQPGTGVGLTLVREFARLHGGDAWAADAGGSGARIVVELADITTT